MMSNPEHRSRLRFSVSITILGLLLALTLGASPGDATTAGVAPSGGRDPVIYVNPEGTGPYPTIQSAIDAVDPGGTVILADGTYSGPGNCGLNFQGKNLTLRSESLDPSLCFIDCESELTEGVYFNSGEDASSIVEGITFQNGQAEAGAGIYIRDSSPTVRNCVFENGYSIDGAGIRVRDGASLIENCVFRYGYVSSGGGIRCVYASAQIRDCHFEHNTAWTGGAISLDSSPGTVIEGCVFLANSAKDAGGAIDLWESPDTVIEDCIFFANVGNVGGAISQYASSALISDCTFAENSSQIGSAIVVSGDGPGISRSIIAFGDSPPIVCYVNGRALPQLNCCDLFGNKGGDWTDCIAGQEGVDGNFSADPQFCGVLGSGNLLLQSDSPCRPGGNSCGVFIGAEPIGCDATATARASWSTLKRLY